MTESTLFGPEVGSAISLLERAREWEVSSPASPREESLELLVASASQQARVLQLAWSLSTREGSVWETDWYRQRIKIMEFLSGIVANILSRTQEILECLHEDHPECTLSSSAGEVGSLLQKVKEIEAKSKQTLHWLDRPRPPVDEEMIRRSQESLDRNEGEDIREIISRMESGGTLVKE